MTRRSEIVTSNGRLYHLGIDPLDVAPRVFLVGDPARAYKVATRFESIEHEVKHREYVTLTGRHAGLEMSVIGTGMGTDNVEIALVELHAAHALDLDSGLPKETAPQLDLIRVGTSGGVQGGMSAGMLCIAEYAIGLDSTGPYYQLETADRVLLDMEGQVAALLRASIDAGARFRDRLPVYASRAHPRVHDALVRQAESSGAAHASGVTVSAPSFYGASSRYIEGLVNTVPDIKGTLAKFDVDGRRVLNMEMESSLLFHLAGALGHRAGTICPAISRPDAASDLVDYDERIEVAIDIALAAMVDLAATGTTTGC